MTPPGAPALRVFTPRTHSNYACPLPLTAPWKDPAREEARERRGRALEHGDIPGWMRAGMDLGRLEEWLLAALRATVDVSGADLVKLCDLVAGPSWRLGELPSFRAEESYAGYGNRFMLLLTWALDKEKRGAAARAIFAAVAHDLEGCSRHDVSWMLGLSDHEDPAEPGDPDALPSLLTHGKMVRLGEANRAGKFIRRGREINGLVGAWPWTHSPKLGWLPRNFATDWEHDSTYAKPLQEWRIRSCDEQARAVVSARKAWPPL